MSVDTEQQDLVLLAHELGAKLVFLFTSIRQPLLELRGVSLRRAGVLAHMVKRGPTRISDLAKALAVTQPTMTAMANGLVREGLAYRLADEADSRVVLLDVTPAGHDLVVSLRRLRANALAERLSQLPDKELASVREAVQSLDFLVELLVTDGTADTFNPDDVL